ncbi:4'-phosphopantetheinyl transferase superfamily protein [Paraburkholderia sp. MMS20-SJTR3]|uniref:4'-phosphopantetheinyl transferase superfamily protein n=1 Tax=Paraburkholderia sejongensis TaxID=2886946 RepID=A0ABS8K1Y6_9BURK|nr:4'-phosphopantetheinyl transferase superfamily protein [Paraburkholderia sp. MMS20-SJTR3]MCC8396162.1 4'-phosphopantetheinyl transferase superfamily protein [Paraburkholderia sp. MMS20-SJTR3]
MVRPPVNHYPHRMNSTLAAAAPDFDFQPLAIPRAAAAGVEVFCVTFDFTAMLDHHAFAVLSDTERAKAARYLRHEDAVRHAATRVALRELLAERTGIAPAVLRFEQDAAGRPRLAGSADPAHQAAHAWPDFNVSHSGQHALIALAARRKVGVDIEVARRDKNWQALTPAVFAPRDEAAVAALPDERRVAAFYDIWTAKEALLKALGVGIGEGMTWFSVLHDDDDGDAREPRVALDDPRARSGAALLQLDAVWLQVPAGYAGCVAWSRATETPRA